MKKTPPTLKEINSWYRDQGISRGYASAAYTEYGLRRMDGEFVRRICLREEDPKKLATEIRKNPHLHKEIKKNLLGNLRRFVKDGDFSPPYKEYEGPPWEIALQKELERREKKHAEAVAKCSAERRKVVEEIHRKQKETDEHLGRWMEKTRIEAGVMGMTVEELEKTRRELRIACDNEDMND